MMGILIVFLVGAAYACHEIPPVDPPIDPPVDPPVDPPANNTTEPTEPVVKEVVKTEPVTVEMQCTQ